VEEEKSHNSNHKAPIPNLPIELPEKLKPSETLTKMPQVRPEIKQNLDNTIPTLTNVELAYAWRLLKQTTISRVAQTKQTANQQQQEHIDPVLQPILDDIKKAEEYMTRGFTVQYPPKSLVPLGQQNDLGLFDIVDMALQRLDSLFKNPNVQNQVARLIGALADKLEGKP
jgi:hypothetical protein